MKKMLLWKYVDHSRTLAASGYIQIATIYKNTVDDNDLKDKVKTLTILYLTHHPMIMQIKLMRCMQLTSIVSF